MLFYEVRKIVKMTFFLQNLTAKLGFRHLAIEVRRHCPVKRPKLTVDQDKFATGTKRNIQTIRVILSRIRAEHFGEKNLDLDNVVYATLLGKS